MNQKQHGPNGVLAQFGIGHGKRLPGVAGQSQVSLDKICRQTVKFFSLPLGYFFVKQPVTALQTRLHLNPDLFIGQSFAQSIAPFTLESRSQSRQGHRQIQQHRGITGHDARHRSDLGRVHLIKAPVRREQQNLQAGQGHRLTHQSIRLSTLRRRSLCMPDRPSGARSQRNVARDAPTNELRYRQQLTGLPDHGAVHHHIQRSQCGAIGPSLLQRALSGRVENLPLSLSQWVPSDIHIVIIGKFIGSNSRYPI